MSDAIPVLIAHAAWLPERKRTLARLLEQLPNAIVLSSERREHATQWAMRLWQRAADLDAQAVVCLNDDVTVVPRFEAIVDCMVTAQPGRTISLHTSLPEAARLVGPVPFVRSYWLTGPGYILPNGVPGQLLDYWSALPWSYASRQNEDNIGISWAWSKQEPIWQCIPALVTHDVETKSSLGYDHHDLRSATVPWERFPNNERLTHAEYWRTDADPPFVENPWARSDVLESARRIVAAPHPCEMCWLAQAVIGRGGLEICANCLGESVAAILKQTRAK